MIHQFISLAPFLLLAICCASEIDATPTTSPTYDVLLTTKSPTTRQPSLRPVTSYPSLQPTDRPATPFPTEMPISDSPSSKTISDSPSLQPTVPNTQQLPTTTMKPSKEPISNSPISRQPSESPTSNRQPTIQPSLEPMAGGRSTTSDTEITFDTDMNANDIVHNHLLETNSTIQIHNVISSYHSCYALYTNAIRAGLYHDSGVILSTGNPTDFNTNDSDETSTNFDIESDDTDLVSLLPNNDTRVYDPCYIQFDFMCPSSSSTIEEEDTSVTFNYIFGSEEYGNLRYHNDIFGAFLNGQNIATVPDKKDGSSIPITISNINSETNSEYYVNNELVGRINETSPYPGIEANGFTIELQASGKVLTGEWNTIKLVIGDLSDGNIDSWALIEAGSFSCGSSSGGSWKEERDVIRRPFEMEMSMAVGFLILFGLLALAIPIVGLLFYNKSCSTSQ